MKEGISRGPYSARATARRRQIIEAAADCFRRSGFRGASMADISAAACMSTGHIYYYFSSKDEIVEAVIDSATFGVQAILDETVRAVFGIPKNEGDAVGACDPCLVLAAFTEALYNPAVNAFFLDHESKTLAALESLMGNENAKGHLVPGMDAVFASAMLTSLLYGLLTRAALNPGSEIAVLRATLETVLKTIVVTAMPTTER